MFFKYCFKVAETQEIATRLINVPSVIERRNKVGGTYKALHKRVVRDKSQSYQGFTVHSYVRSACRVFGYVLSQQC